MQVTYGLLGPFSHGRGYQDPVYLDDPAAGSGASYTVPGQYWSKLIAATFTLTTSSNVADRYVTIDYSNGNGVRYYSDGTGTAVPASQTDVVFNASALAAAATATDTYIWFPLFGVFLPSGTNVAVNVANIDSTDQLAGIVLLFENIETGEAGYPIGGMDTGDYQAWRETFAD